MHYVFLAAFAVVLPCSNADAGGFSHPFPLDDHVTL